MRRGDKLKGISEAFTGAFDYPRRSRRGRTRYFKPRLDNKMNAFQRQNSHGIQP